jgi:hypothetical protein
MTFITAIYSQISLDEPYIRMDGPFESAATANQFIFMHLIESGTLSIQFNNPLKLNENKDDLFYLFNVEVAPVTSNEECNQVIYDICDKINNCAQLNCIIEALRSVNYYEEHYYYELKQLT